MPWENPTHEDSDPVTERKLWLPVTVLGKSGFAAHFLVTGLLLSLFVKHHRFSERPVLFVCFNCWGCESWKEPWVRNYTLGM